MITIEEIKNILKEMEYEDKLVYLSSLEIDCMKMMAKDIIDTLSISEQFIQLDNVLEFCYDETAKLKGVINYRPYESFVCS